MNGRFSGGIPGPSSDIAQTTTSTPPNTAAGLDFTDASGTNIVHKKLGTKLPIIGAQSQVANALSSAAVTAGTYSSANVQTYADMTTGQI